MKFAVITHINHKEKDGICFSYEPYVRETNMWFKYVDEVRVVGGLVNGEIDNIETSYKHPNLQLDVIPSFDITSVLNTLKAFFLIPIISFRIFKVMLWADHIHLRCPGNIGLLGCFIQILFPSKPKTVKYAGNWDPKSKQPFSYRLQKRILSNTFLTRNTKVLVYGKWGSQTKNILPFFTASYSENEVKSFDKKSFTEGVQLIFVGGFAKGKQPILTVKTAHELRNKGINVQLNMYGDGVERKSIEKYIKENDLEDTVFVHGNVDKETVKSAFKSAHFLIFISKSEGWPKVVAEAMFWGCLPITTAVSCVPYMVDNGSRGAIVSDDLNEIVSAIESYIGDDDKFRLHTGNGFSWSRQFTLEKFESEIKALLKN